MVGTRKLARLLDHAQDADAKVVLVGDPCQLPEIDAGGAFRGLRARLGASLLTQNRRQADQWERQSLGELRHGNVDQALDSYLAHGRVHQAASDDQARELLVEEWINAHLEGEDVLMVASHLHDVDDLNGRARRILQEEGYLGADEIRVGCRAFSEGDQVRALRNDYGLGLLNGTRGTIHHIDLEREHLVITTEANVHRAVPFEYLASGHLTHGYATTIHKAQGSTVDRCLILADDTATREHAYTALSRGRHSNELYFVAEDRRVEERHAREVHADPLAGLRAAIGRSGAKNLALDHLTPAPSSTLDALQDQRRRLIERLGPEPPDMSTDVRRLIDQQRRVQDSLQDARRRLHRAEQDLDQLGPIRRRTFRSQRREVEQRITRFTAEVRQVETKLATIGSRIAEHGPGIGERSDWETCHAVELDLLDRLDHQIDMIHRLDNIAQHTVERRLERDHGVELGL